MLENLQTPKGGGLYARASVYPGFEQQNAFTLSPGECVWLHMAKGDLVRISLFPRMAVTVLDDRSGHFAPELLGLTALPRMSLSSQDYDSRMVRTRLEAMGKSHDELVFLDCGDDDPEPIVWQAKAPIVVILAWRQLQTDLVTGNLKYPPTEITIKPAQNDLKRLPDPLGHVVDEFTIPRGTAFAYELAKGQFVQVIDVDGRQCSDFMAMNAHQLDKGVERYIDSAVTRSMVGGAYPGPGLYDKFYDQDMNPLLSVTQDTVGRHDTFALACTARGYEERGFPGHVNCSDNISNVYAPYGIQGRRAWPAINFFFNTWINPADNRIQSDEAWSRPGDYVAMRALTDLVCVSTACPDDIDPINGWNPTDVHVRIYEENSAISRAVAYRPYPQSPPVMTQNSPFHQKTSKLATRFMPARDYWVPEYYEATGVLEEYWACREKATLQDMSQLRKYDVCGPDAERLLDKALTKPMNKLAIGRVVYCLMLDEQGQVIDDGTVLRLAQDVFRWTCGTDESALHLKELAERENMNVWLRDMTRTLCNLAVQGPKSRDILSPILFTQPTHPRFESVKWFGFTIARLHDRDGIPLLVSRTGYTGELGYEIFCDARDAEILWDACMEAGGDDLCPMGGHAMELLRVEAGLMANTHEFAPHVHVDEAGLSFVVSMTKDDFIGKKSVEQYRQAPKYQLLGLVMDADEVPIHGDTVFKGRRPVGVITSAIRSPTLGKSIAMARLATHVSLGEVLEVGKLDGHMKRLTATVTNIPFVDPERKRARI